ncbi:nucleoporin Nup120/160-domain-containing protein [Phakopsora pachyrhizi]|nr:nucleoporin Nup120/160-domain-containing protein [Phakopsora pachyrhizi]
MEQSYPSLTTSTIFIDSLRPPLDNPIEYQVPSTSATQDDSNPTLRLASSSATSNTIQPSHASQSVTCFPSASCNGFIKASVINDGFTLELRWLSSVKVPATTLELDQDQNGENQNSESQDLDSCFSSLDQNGCHPPVQFHFTEKITPSPYLTVDELENSLVILVLTDAYVLYRLKFTAPHLFYSEMFEEDWASDYEVEAIFNRHVILCHGIDSNNLILSCSDGVLTHLSWGPLIGIDNTYGWKTSNLTTRPGFWGLLPNWSSAKTVSSSAHEWIATPSTTIAMASHVTAGASGEDGWIFTVSRDRKLRVWSLTTGVCARELSLQERSGSSLVGNSIPNFSNGTGSEERLGASLLPAAPRNLARFIYSDEGDDPTYEGFLIVFVPSALSPTFLTYGMLLGGDHRFRDLVLLEERRCDLSHYNPKMGELHDFKISKIDFSLSYATVPLKNRPWGLWAVWDDDLGGEGLVQYTALHETRSWQGSSSSDWITITPPDRGTPWNSSFFDEILANDPSLSVTQAFVEHLFRPGHFSTSDLDYALETYEAQLETDLQLDHQRDQATYNSLEEKICATVGSNVTLEISNVTGSPMIDVFNRKLRIEWLKFATMCAESRTSSLWPLELAVDPDRQQVWVMGRRSITAPVLIDTATLLSQITTEKINGGSPALLHEQNSDVERFHPLLSNLNNRLDLASIIDAVSALIRGLSHSEVVRPIEVDISQVIKKPMKFSITDISEDLFARRLEPFISDALRADVSSKIKNVKDLEFSLQILWKILTTSELVKFSIEDSLDADIPSHRATILSQMLISDCLLSTIESRHSLLRNTLVFLLYVHGEEDVNELFRDFPGLISQFFGTYHQIYILRWVSHQCSKISPELAFEVEDDLVDKLTGLHVSNNEVGGDGLLITDASSATSLLSSLILTRFIPELASSIKLPASITLACSRFLDHTGLLRNLSSLSNQDVARIKMIETYPRNVEFINYLLQVGLNGAALEMIDMYPDCGTGLTFLKGQAFIQLGQIEDAETCFIRAASAVYDDNFLVDDESALRSILPAHASTSVRAYFSYVVSLLEPLGVDMAIAKFCQLAIDGSVADHTYDQESDSDEEKRDVLDLYNRLFKAYINLGLWDDAYETLISIPSSESKHNCLRTLVSSMCEANEFDKLLQFSFAGIQGEFERTIAFRARNSDPLSVPNYYQILYAYHLGKGDYRSAGMAMYHHGRKIGDIAIKGNAFQVLMTQQCQSYLSAINALSLVPEKHAWICVPCRKSTKPNSSGYLNQTESRASPSGSGIRKRRRINFFIPEKKFSSGTTDMEILTLADIRKEYTLVLSRLQLANELPQLSHPGSSTSSSAYLDGETLVPIFVNQGRVTEALEKATVLETDMIPIFEKLAESCCRLTKEGENSSDDFDQHWVNSDPMGADWDGDVISKAWKLLQIHLRNKFPLNHQKAWECREAIVDTILKSDREVKIPIWLLDDFIGHGKFDRLIKKFFKYNLIQDAFTVAMNMIEQVEFLSRFLYHMKVRYSN